MQPGLDVSVRTLDGGDLHATVMHIFVGPDTNVASLVLPPVVVKIARKRRTQGVDLGGSLVECLLRRAIKSLDI